MTTRLVMLGAAWWLVATGLASAHQQIAPDDVPIGKPAFLTVTAANERPTALEQLTLLPPAGITLGTATRQPPPWTAGRAADRIVWSGGAVAPGSFEQWGFEIDPPGQPGPLRFRLVLAYAGGAADETDVEVTAVAGTAESGAVATTAAAGPPATGVSTMNGNLPPRDDRVTTVLVLAVTGNVTALVALGISLRARAGGRRSDGARDGEVEDW